MAITDTDITFLLRKRLADSTPVAALVGDRIRPDVIEPNEKMPAIRYELITSTPYSTISQPGRDAVSRVQFDCLADTPTMRNDLAEAVRNRLEGFRGALGTIRVESCVRDNMYDRIDPPPPGSKHYRYRRTIDFQVVHTTPTPTLA